MFEESCLLIFTDGNSLRLNSIVVSCPAPHSKLVLNIAASESETLKQRIKQTKEYGIAIGATQTALIHFLAVDHDLEAVTSVTDEQIDVIHVNHDLKWTKCTLYYNNHTEEYPL